MTDNEKKQETFKVRDLRGTTDEEATATEIPEPEPKTKEKESQEDVPINFTTFIMSMSTSALMHMGLMEHPETKKAEKNLDVARQEIDIIEMMQEKTKGNLTPQEEKLVENVLYELRLRFVEASK